MTLPHFSAIDVARIETATREAVDAAGALVDEALAGPPEDVVATLDEAIDVVVGAADLVDLLAQAHPDASVRETATAHGEQLRKWVSSLVFRDDVAAAIRAMAATAAATTLRGERARSLAWWLRDLRRAGHDLDPEERAALEERKNRLIELEVAFERNLAEWEDHVDVPPERLAGMSPEYIERLGPGEEPGTLRITMAYPDYLPFMDEGADRELRRTLQFRFWNRATDANTPLLAEAVALRREMAALLGRASWAEHAMEVKMADPPAVHAFFERIVPPLTTRGHAELDTLTELAAGDGVDTVQPWDWTYYDTRQRKEEFGLDPNEVAAYLPLDRVVAGLLELTGEVFGLSYRELPDADTWHEDVVVYEITDAGSDEPIAFFYADLFPREGKFGHAAMFPVARGGTGPDGRRRLPVAAILANFTKPTADSPSLLKHSEAVTLFHEFGHVLHHCLARPELARFDAMATEWDFVEAPSQILENWMWEPEVVARFARHHETGEPIPRDLVERLVAARDHNIALRMLRQVFFAELDLALHDTYTPPHPDEACRATWHYTLLPFHEGTHLPASFGHLMGGYDAGYYGYLWSKVYGDDMFSVFAAEGVDSPEVGARYRREILEPGATRDAIESLRAFLGREPSPDAFLRRIGVA